VIDSNNINISVSFLNAAVVGIILQGNSHNDVINNNIITINSNTLTTLGNTRSYGIFITAPLNGTNITYNRIFTRETTPMEYPWMDLTDIPT